MSEAPGQALPFSRLLHVVTGSLSAATLPSWAGWLRTVAPATDVRTVVTRSALQFVTPTALAVSTSGPVHVDAWSGEAGTVAPGNHVEWAAWPDAVLVYPASWHFVARLALGLGDSPALLALHCTRAPVLVAPSLPPGAIDSPVMTEHLRTLAGRPGYAVAPVRSGRSAHSGRPEAPVPDDLPGAIRLLARLVTGEADTPQSSPLVAAAGQAP